MGQCLHTFGDKGTTLPDDPNISLQGPLAVFLHIPQEKPAVDSLAKIAPTVVFELPTHNIYAVRIGCSQLCSPKHH